MSARWLGVMLLLAAGCGSATRAGTAESVNGGMTTEVTASTQAAEVTVGTTPGAVYQQVQLEATLPSLDGPARLWRTPAISHDPTRLVRWARAFGFTDEEISTATGTRIVRNTPDGQVLTISETIGRWNFVDGPAGMFAEPGACPLPSVAPPSTVASATSLSFPTGQRCADPPPPGIPDAAAAEAQARSLWRALGIDLTGMEVTVGGDEYLREVIASDNLSDVVVARLRVVIGTDGRLLRATGSDAPVAAGSVARLGVAAALDRFARQPPSSGPASSAPASFDGVYRVTGVTAGLTGTGDQWLVPSYVVALADGRTITLLAIDPSDIPTG